MARIMFPKRRERIRLYNDYNRRRYKMIAERYLVCETTNKSYITLTIQRLQHTIFLYNQTQ